MLQCLAVYWEGSVEMANEYSIFFSPNLTDVLNSQLATQVNEKKSLGI